MALRRRPLEFAVSDIGSEGVNSEGENEPDPEAVAEPGAKDEHEAVAEPEPALEQMSTRERSNSITSYSDANSSEEDGNSSDKEPDANFGARAPVHPSQMGDLLPPMFPRDRCFNIKTYRDLKNANERGDLDARLKILKALEKNRFRHLRRR
jgi:hypothetical protein